MLGESVKATALQFNYRDADKSLTRPNSRCTLFDGENISFDASLVVYSYIKVKQSRNRPGVAHRVPRGLGSQIFMTFGT
jgi:hypothetical protein